MTKQLLRAEDLDLRDLQLVMGVIAPSLGERIGSVVGDIERTTMAIRNAAQLLASGDGLSIAGGVAGLIQTYTSWLRNKISADNATERANLVVAQATFVGPPGPRWMWRQAVGGPPARHARTRLGVRWPSTRVLAQWKPGAVYIYPRIGWDVVRRSFRRTDLANCFDIGQPDLVWTSDDSKLASCLSRYAEYWEGRGCAYNPGEVVQLSPGTWPYVSGADVLAWSGVTAVDCAAHYLALHTPSAIHVQTDARVVEAAWKRWRSTVLDNLPLVATVGQVDDGVYRTATGQVFFQGSPMQTFRTRIGSFTWNIRAEAARYVTDSFLGFFELRKAVLRDWAFVAPSVKEAGRTSSDPTVRARALGLEPPTFPAEPSEPPTEPLPAEPSKPSSGRGGLALAALAGGFLLLRR